MSQYHSTWPPNTNSITLPADGDSPADTQRWNNIASTLIQRRIGVVLTLCAFWMFKLLVRWIISSFSIALTELLLQVQRNEPTFHPQWQYSSKLFLWWLFFCYGHPGCLLVFCQLFRHPPSSYTLLIPSVSCTIWCADALPMINLWANPAMLLWVHCWQNPQYPPPL